MRADVSEAAAWAEAEPKAAPGSVLRHTWADHDVTAPAWLSAI